MPWAILDVDLQMQHAASTTALYRIHAAHSYLSIMHFSPAHDRTADAGRLQTDLQT